MDNGFPWEIFYVLGAVLLAGGIAYGMIQYYSRNKRNDAITEEATRMEYDAPLAYKHGGREALKDQAERNQG
jgi:hypothetical protein